MSETFADLEPKDLGLGFPDFREIQRQAMEFAIYSDKRFRSLCIPPGGGKSGIALGVSQLTGWRTLVYTATLGLEDQYLKTEREFEISSIHGRANYECSEWKGKRPELGLMCDDGARLGCKLMKGNGCCYEDWRAKARRGQLVLTNYAYGLTVHSKGGGLTQNNKDGSPTNPFDCLILDEVHLAAQQVRRFLSAAIGEKEIKELLHVETTPDCGEDLRAWREFAALHLEPLKSEYDIRRSEAMKEHRKAGVKDFERIRRMESLIERLDRIGSSEDNEWVCDYKEGDSRFGRRWSFNVISPGRYCERYLFMGIPNVVAMSATNKRKTMWSLGVPDRELAFKEWPRVFPANRCPVYFIPARKSDGKGIGITKASSIGDKLLWIGHMDVMMKSRLDRRIVIITTSYEYQRLLTEMSAFKQYMIGNTGDPDSDSATEKFEEFCRTPPPVILVSPSFGTGWDFKYDRGEFLLIPKIPLKPPTGSSKLITAILERDPEFNDCETTFDLAQWCGRLQREEDDQGEVVIVDNSWAWFAKRAEKFAPMGFVNGVRRPDKLPKAPARLERRN